MNDRGSFVVAARLLEDSSQVLLPLRWVALVMPGGMEETKLQSLAGKSIAAVQSTVVMATRESHYFRGLRRLRPVRPVTTGADSSSSSSLAQLDTH